jgi:hypothetical protein
VFDFTGPPIHPPSRCSQILTIFKAERMLNIDLFLDRAIEEGTFHVHLIELKAMVSSIGK